MPFSSLILIDFCLLFDVCSNSVKDEEEGEGAQGECTEYDTRCSGQVRVGLRFRFPEYEESQVQGV